jgi:sirohydrochlorin cobaltochelatase
METGETRTGILLCGHGSRDAAALEEFAGLARAVAAHCPEPDFAFGYLEFAEPSLADALEALRARGVTRVLAAPAMLFAAGHVTDDIPGALGAYAAEHPGIEIAFGEALDTDPRMLGAATARVVEAIGDAREEILPEETLLLAVGRGAKDHAVNAKLAVIAHHIRDTLGLARAETAFAGIAEPRVEAALAHAARNHTGRTHGGRRHVERIVVLPYLLLTGVLVGRVRELAAAAAARHPEIDFVVAGHLGAHPLVVETFLARIEALRDPVVGVG